MNLDHVEKMLIIGTYVQLDIRTETHMQVMNG